MSSIVRYTKGKHVYLYDSISYRDENGEPQNTRKLVGKIDPESGQPVYKTEYIEHMAQQGVALVSYQPPPSYTIDQIRQSDVKAYGAFYLYQALAGRAGLIDTLEAVFPSCWQQIFMLACYLVSTGDPALYLEDWLSGTESLPDGSMTSQRVSELLSRLQEHERRSFYQKWAVYRSEQEYLALNITSVSAYSSLIDAVEWGYNRDGEDLPQVNLCLLLGEKSRLPVFQTLYSGSLKDVSTIKATLAQACGITLDHLLLVMDKGFCSTGNMNAMLDDPPGIRFVIALPFTMSFAQKQVQSEKKDIDRIENAILVGPDLLRGVTKERVWNKDHSLYVHVYFNIAAATKVKEDLIAHVTALRQKALQDPENKQYRAEFDRYLIIRKAEMNTLGYTVNIRGEVIEKELAYAGWLVLASNHIQDKQEAIDIYRDKDVVGKGFDRYKNSLDLNRFRVHSENSMHNKSFVGFIALILMSSIHMVMKDKDMYRDRTMKQLIRTLDKLKLQTIDGNRILYPNNREQMVIIGKGAAGNADRKRRLTPFDISHDLYDTLARLQTSYVDLYILHRDDPNQPAGPIVEALNEHISEGRIRAIGGSNWTSERLEAANEYAYAHHLVPFRASSPNFSLAEQVVNPWADSDVTLSGNKGMKERERHQKSQIAVFSWSSMARGFWSGRFNRQTFASVKNNLDPWCVKAYCHETNFARLDRVEALSALYHVSVPQIAVAYIMHQSLNIFAIIGAASKEELMANIVGLTVPLTQDDRNWIDLTTDSHPVLG